MVTAIIKSKNGLHARPTSIIVEASTKFSGDVFFIRNGERFNGKSIMNIMSMGLIEGESIEIEAVGTGAQTIEEVLKKIIEGIEE